MFIETENSITASLSERITADFRQKIASGAWAAGSALPTRRDLAKAYGVALRTIEQAMAPLIGEGVVEARGVKGTFVAPSRTAEPQVRRVQHRQRPAQASLLPKAVTHATIGIVGAWTGHEQHYMVNNLGARAMEAAASKHPDVTLRYFNRFVDYDLPRRSPLEAVTTLIDEGVNAIAMFYSVDDPLGIVLDAVMAKVQDHGLPIVFFDNSVLTRDVCRVLYDNEHAGYQAANHLFNRGWERAIFVNCYESDWVRERVAGAQAASAAYRREHDVKLSLYAGPRQFDSIRDSDFFREIGNEIGQSLFAQFSEASAIIAPNDITAYGIMESVSALGLRAGIDYGIVGFDDYVESRERALSTLRPPLTAMGTETIDLLLRALAGTPLPLRVVLRSELVARTSSLCTSAQVRDSALHFAPAIL